MSNLEENISTDEEEDLKPPASLRSDNLDASSHHTPSSTRGSSSKRRSKSRSSSRRLPKRESSRRQLSKESSSSRRLSKGKSARSLSRDSTLNRSLRAAELSPAIRRGGKREQVAPGDSGILSTGNMSLNSIGDSTLASTISEITNPVDSPGNSKRKKKMERAKSARSVSRSLSRDKSSVGFADEEPRRKIRSKTSHARSNPSSGGVSPMRPSSGNSPRRSGSRDSFARSQSVRVSRTNTSNLNTGGSSHRRSGPRDSLAKSQSVRVSRTSSTQQGTSRSSENSPRRSGNSPKRSGSRDAFARSQSVRAMRPTTPGLSMGSSHGRIESQSVRMTRTTTLPPMPRLASARMNDPTALSRSAHSRGSSSKRMSKGKSSRGLSRERDELSPTASITNSDGAPRKKTKRRMNRELNSSRRRQSSRDLSASRRVEHTGAIEGGPLAGIPSSVGEARVRVSNAGSFGNRLGKTLLYEPAEEEKEMDDMEKPPDKKKSRKRFFRKQGKDDEEEEPTTNTTQLRGASTIEGRKAIDLKVLRVAGDVEAISSMQQSVQTGGYVDLSRIARRPRTFEPKHLLDIERGASVLITSQSLVKHHKFQALGEYGAVVVTMKAKDPSATEDTSKKDGPPLKKMIKSKDIRDLDFESEVGRIERFKLSRLRRKMIRNLDEINCLRLSRQLQYYLPLQSAYDAYLISQLIQALEGKLKAEETNFVLNVAFKSRNISRIISKIVGPNFDFSDHDHQMVSWGRIGDMATRYPLIGVSQLPATENWMPLRNYVPWLGGVLLSGRKELYTTNQEDIKAQNMSAEMNGFELANRNIFGAYAGRLRTNKFRSENRFSTDQEMMESFLSRPIPTLVDNGVVHTLRLLAQHWSRLLSDGSKYFANDLIDQLDPFETMRLYMPAVCIVLSSLRGHSSWDSRVLAPFVRRCQELKPAFTADRCRFLIREMKEKIITDLCAGIASVYDPMDSWLDSLMTACTLIEAEARQVYQKITTVEIGLRLGYDLVTQVHFEIPSDADILSAILLHLQGKSPGKEVRERSLRDAMNLMTPRDKKTLMELVKKNLIDSKPAKLLLDRTRAFLKRVLRREYFSEAIRHLSMGEFTDDIFHDEWYWIIEGQKKGVYIYNEDGSTNDADCFLHVDSGMSHLIDLDDDTVKFRTYIPIAESISRAQRCYMNVALDHGKLFRYNAFMEFSFLRAALRQLSVISLIFCEELDDARMTIMREVQRANQDSIAVRDMRPGETYYVYNENTTMFDAFPYENQCSPGDPEWSRLTRSKIVKTAPQNVVLVGDGPNGLLTLIHSAESVLATGGAIKLYGMSKERVGAAFEKAEIVRLDQRWAAMLRFYLGTAFADTFVPTSETDAPLGNIVPSQGYVEVTMKDLENMLHLEVSRLWSKGVVQVFTDADAQYDPDSNALTKLGEHLKLDDLLVRKINGDGKKSDQSHSWRVIDLVQVQALGLEELKVGIEYGVYVRLQDAVLPFKLAKVDLQSRTYTFESLSEAASGLVAAAHNLPAVYPKGTTKHAGIESIVIECIEKSSSGVRRNQEIPMKRVSDYRFTLDLRSSHVFECIGKSADSTTHLSTTTSEPYGMCCLQGLKISMMHNFGVTSGNAENSTVGDKTKMVRLQAVAEYMIVTIKKKHWKMHFLQIFGSSMSALEQLIESIKSFSEKSKKFRRQTLHAQFFETCDNFYVGMELAHGYENWRNKTADDLEKLIKKKATGASNDFSQTMAHNIDRLWFQSCLEVIRDAGVYDHAARRRFPQLYLVNSYSDEDVGNLEVGDAFKVSEKPGERYELVVKDDDFVFARTVNGHMIKMKPDRQVCRQSDLTRSADGVQESSCAVSTFPVEQFVNHRSARVNNDSTGYVFAFIGDEQATPHFMRSSQLAGGATGAILVNNFLKGAIDGQPFLERLERFCTETDGSNGKVVASSISSNHALDGFLRLGFTYKQGIDYLHAKVLECRESGQDVKDALSADWKSKFAAPMVPRGMELNQDFISSLRKKIHEQTFDKFISDLKKDKLLATETLIEILLRRKEEMDSDSESLDPEKYWDSFLNGIEEDLTEAEMEELEDLHCDVAKEVEQNAKQILEYAKKESLYNERLPSEFFNQPKPVDSIVDDGALESQHFAEAFVTCAGIASVSLAFALISDNRGLNIFCAAALAGINVLLTTAIMINVSRYKIRVEELRLLFAKQKFHSIQKSVFCLMSSDARSEVRLEKNPFAIELEKKVQKFRVDVGYYGIPKPNEFLNAFSDFKGSMNDPEAIKTFQRVLCRHFIANVYHENSDLQDSLVKIYQICDYMYNQFTDGPMIKKDGSNMAKNLLRRLRGFGPRLEKSLQSGQVFLGFLKHRRILQWNIFVVVRFFYGLCCCARAGGSTPLAPIQTETYGILKGAQELSKYHNNRLLRREVCDLRNLHFATRESDMASTMLVAAFLIHFASWSFMVIRLIELFIETGDLVLDIGFFASLTAVVGVIVTSFRLLRKFFTLVVIWWKLGRKARKNSSDIAPTLRKAKGVAFMQILITYLRLLSAWAACVAIGWNVALRVFFEEISSNRNILAWITKKEYALWAALGAVAITLLANCVSFIVDYLMQYTLSPRMGEHICEAYRKQIETMYQKTFVRMNDIEPKLLQERRTWEYVAHQFCHRHRFDLVFSMERFGMIFQFIQSGMDKGVASKSTPAVVVESAQPTVASAPGIEVSLGP